MIKIRKGTFETNSSSTHTLVFGKNTDEENMPLAKHIKIEWIDTDDYYYLEGVKEKLSYLISHIANKVKWDCNTYEELLEEIQDNFEYKEIAEFIKEKYDKEIRFPDNKNNIYTDMEYVCEINHQLIPWGSGAVIDEVLSELIEYSVDSEDRRMYNPDAYGDLSFKEKLEIYFTNGVFIRFGRD